MELVEVSLYPSDGLKHQESPPCGPLAQGAIDYMIIAILEAAREPVYQLSHYISVHQFIYICHKVVDVLKTCETLEYVHDKNGMAVIGDIHADFSDLMKALNNTGWPTERTIVFLGDYVDRGKHPVEVLILVFLLKIRYPRRVILLRGNHETYEQCSKYNLLHYLEFIYPEEDKMVLFCMINNAFDYLPLAAILSDQVLCCHGGISQFAESRADIASIPRPPRWLAPPTTLFQVTIMTDLLWSDPMDQEQEYSPSDRNVSYFFNDIALLENLNKLRCRALIRGHRAYNHGFQRVHNGLCYTVHSSRNRATKTYTASVLLLHFDPQTCLLHGEAKYYSAGTNDSVKWIIDGFLKHFEKYRNSVPMELDFDPDEPCVTCEQFINGISPKEFAWRRCLNCMDYKNTIYEYRDCGLLFVDRFCQELDKYAFNPKMMAMACTTTFPYFMQFMLKSEVLLRCHPSTEMIDPRPNYDFRFELPAEGQDWPILDVLE